MVCRRIEDKNKPGTYFGAAMHATVISQARKTPTQQRRSCV